MSLSKALRAVPLLLGLVVLPVLAIETSAEEKTCQELGFKSKTEKFADCLIELRKFSVRSVKKAREDELNRIRLSLAKSKEGRVDQSSASTEQISDRTTTKDLRAKTQPPGSESKISWEGTVTAIIRSRIRFDASSLQTNPEAAFTIDLSEVGRVLGIKLLRSSDVPEWDAACIRAIAASNPLPSPGERRVIELRMRPIDSQSF